MKVLMVSEYFYPENRGGGEISAFLLAKELTKSGIEMHVLTSHFDGLKRAEKKEGVFIHRRMKTGKNPTKIADQITRFYSFEKSMLKELERLQEEESFDVIHCMNISSIFAVRLKKKIRRRFILHVNSPVLFCPKATLMYKDLGLCSKKCTRQTFLGCYLNSRFIGKVNLGFHLKYNPLVIFTVRRRYEKYQKLLKEFDHYMPISNFMKEQLILSGIDKKKITVVYNIVELDKFYKLKQPKNKIPKILYLGEYSRPKGPQLIIDALKDVNIS